MTTLKFNKSILLDALLKTAIVIPQRSLVPYCEFVRFRSAGDHHVMLSVTDTHQDMCITVPCENQPADFVVVHKDLLAYVRNCTEEITFVIEEKRCVIRNGDEKAVFPLGDGEIIIKSCDINGSIHLPSTDVDSIYQSTKSFIPSDPKYDFLFGAMVFVKNKVAEIYAGDEFTFLKITVPIEMENRNFILPTSFLKAMHILNSETLYVGFDESSCWLESAGAKYYTKFVNANLPKMEPYFDKIKKSKIDVTFEVEALEEAIRKASIFTDFSIKLDFDKNMRLYAISDDKDKNFSTFIECEHNAPKGFEIVVGYKYLLRTLEQLSGKVTMKMSESNEPIFFDEEICYLIMPIKI